MILSVWAPSAKSVDVLIEEGRRRMRPMADGRWQLEVAERDIGAGYRYSIDGAEPVPDPRSGWQPHGVHGASYLAEGVGLKQGARASPVFRAKPLDQAVIYELHVGTFTPDGSYNGAREKLGHLVALGVTHVELMPVSTFPGRRGWGYDGVDLFAPFPAYGTPAQLAGFIDDCHAHGLAVLLDVVYNHLGPDGNYLGQFAPYFTDRYKTGWGAALNFDGAQSDEVRSFVIDNALLWLRDYGFDGLRLDAVHAIYSFAAVHPLEELSTAVKNLSAELDRPLVLIAESDLNDPRLVLELTAGGYGLDAHWSDDFHHALHRFFTGENEGYYADFQGLEDVATALRDGYVYQGQYSVHRQRRHGRAPLGVAAHQLVVSAQNHDQIGNRAQGERLSMLLKLPQLKAIAALTLLSPFVPLLFQGEEWGAKTPFLYFTDHENVELGRLVAEGRANEFSAFRWQGAVPNPQDESTFVNSKLNWSELAEPAHAELFDWYRRLIGLRGDKVVQPGEGSSISPKPAVHFNAQAGWLNFCDNGVLCVFNFGTEPQHVPIPQGDWRLMLRSDSVDALALTEMPGETTFVYIGG